MSELKDVEIGRVCLHTKKFLAEKEVENRGEKKIINGQIPAQAGRGGIIIIARILWKENGRVRRMSVNASGYILDLVVDSHLREF